MDYNKRAALAVEDKNCVGLISRLYGKSGEVVVKMLDNFPPKAEMLWVIVDQIATPLFVSSLSSQGASKAVVVFEDFESEELVGQLIGKKLYAENAEADDLQESELEFLIGFEFEDLTSANKGRVTAAYDSEMNPLLGVDFAGTLGEVLVPLAEPLIEKLDEKRRRLTMRLAKGFFEALGAEYETI